MGCSFGHQVQLPWRSCLPSGGALASYEIGGIKAVGCHIASPCLKKRKKRAKVRVKLRSKNSLGWREGKGETPTAVINNWRYVTGLHSKPTRIFSVLDNKSQILRLSDRKLNSGLQFSCLLVSLSASFSFP